MFCNILIFVFILDSSFDKYSLHVSLVCYNGKAMQGSSQVIGGCSTRYHNQGFSLRLGNMLNFYSYAKCSVDGG